MRRALTRILGTLPCRAHFSRVTGWIPIRDAACCEDNKVSKSSAAVAAISIVRWLRMPEACTLSVSVFWLG